MDAKAVADRIHEEHSIVVTEQEVLDAQAWLQEERRINETSPATEKKTENTTTSTTPVSGGNPADTRREETSPDSRQVAATSQPSTSNVPTPQSQPQNAELKLIIPEGVPKTPPVPAIDDLIRRGYRSRDDLEAFMKVNFEGKAYRKEVQERLKLFEARQPPFNDIPVTPASTSPVLGADPANTRRESGGVSGAVLGETPPNTGISPGPGSVADTVAATSAPSISKVVAESPPGTELSEEQIISSLAH